ncbi:MAG: hypothetical protein AAF805_00295, partial [Planctomycetota bacterium]
ELTGAITATNGVVVTATLDRAPPAVLLRLANGVGVVSAEISDDADNEESRAVVSIASPDGIAPPLAFDLTLDAAPTAVNPDGTGSVVLLLGEPGAARLASEAKTAAEAIDQAPAPADVEDEPVPAERTARLARLAGRGQGLTSTTAIELTEGDGELTGSEGQPVSGSAGLLCAADFAADLAAGGRVADVLGVAVASEPGGVTGGLVVEGSPTRRGTAAKFLLRAVTAGEYSLRVRVRYHGASGATTARVAVSVAAAAG